MTFDTDQTATLLPNQQIVVVGTMGIMATGTGKVGTQPKGILNALQGMILNGMTVFKALQLNMAAHAELVDFGK